MTTPAGWAELVTTALLGTDRRTLEATDPPATVLHEAARHRVLDRLASPDLVDPPPLGALPSDRAPEQNLPEAPPAADRLLADLLQAPEPTMISYWLRACAEHRRVMAAIHWTRLARLAARTSAYDRVALGAALGPTGRWFLGQNPEWRKLARDAEPETAPEVAGEPAPATDADPPGPLLAEDVLADPERLLSHPQPWSPELVSAAYAVLGDEGRVPPSGTFASRLGVALPPQLYSSIAQAGEFYLLAPDASPARRRAIRDRFVALEVAAYARACVDHAFGNDPSGFPRSEIPRV